MRLKTAVWLLLVFALGAMSSEALASASDFELRKSIILGSTVDDLAVSQDRFVISLNKTGKQLLFIDTWNWRAMTGTVSLVNTVNSMAMNPETSRLYFAFSSGNIQWMDLSPLSTIAFNGSVSSGTLHLETGSTVLSGKTLGQMAVIQPEDSATAGDCLFVETGSSASASLYWMIVQGNTVVKSGGSILANVSNLELTASQNRVFARYKISSTNYLYGSRCSLGSQLVFENASMLEDSGHNFRGLGVEQTGSQLVIGDTTTSQLLLYGVTISGGILVNNYLASKTAEADQVWVKNFASETNPMTFFALGSLLSVLPLPGGDSFGAIGPTIDFDTAPLILANSSTTDGYLYVSPSGSNTVNIVSPNPWVGKTFLSTTPASPIGVDTFTVDFDYDISGSKVIIANCSKFSVKTSGCNSISGGTQTLDGSGVASIELFSENIGEGTHTLGVFVQDAAAPVHQGRNAIQVTINLPPPAQNFSLKFADQRIIFEFHSPDVSDLDEYTIYYGTDSTPPPSGGTPGSPSSPITESAEPGKDYRIIVEDLENGTTYYGQIVLSDTSGLTSTSAVKHTMPQPTESPKDASGDKGGFGCGIISGKEDAEAGAGRSPLLVLIFPLIFLLIVKIKLRGEG